MQHKALEYNAKKNSHLFDVATCIMYTLCWVC